MNHVLLFLESEGATNTISGGSIETTPTPSKKVVKRTDGKVVESEEVLSDEELQKKMYKDQVIDQNNYTF